MVQISPISKISKAKMIRDVAPIVEYLPHKHLSPEFKP
jgi:hypothetical protein